ncbi:JAB domain-containing protein [Desulfobacterium sp. N47]|uniref:DNA repair protein radC homolog n=1 Tax=uncultured Desulfobacterium sp. TaxID=201089 RepID=E1YF31_9BACT|nr:DNA repair protein radC homolog [uncultured Desulfobacterium sp.]
MNKESNPTGIKSWPKDDRPREKLLKKGAGSLSNSELLAILLRTGVEGSSAIDLARQIIDKFGTFRNMSHSDIREWKKFKGMGPAKIAQINAALEIGRRFREDEVISARQQIVSAQDIVNIIMPQMRDLKTEVSKIVYLNSDSRIIDISDAAIGTVNHAIPIVREIIHAALQKFTTSIICIHNHPSANLTPSHEDKKFAAKLTDAGKLMDIKVLDHIIIGDDSYYSFAEHGLME